MLQSNTTFPIRASLLQTAEAADSRSKMAVSAFIRKQYEKEKIRIPDMLKYLCLQYYALIERFYTEENMVNDIKTSEDRRTVLCNWYTYSEKHYSTNLLHNACGIVAVGPFNHNDAFCHYKWHFRVSMPPSMWLHKVDPQEQSTYQYKPHKSPMNGSKPNKVVIGLQFAKISKYREYQRSYSRSFWFKKEVDIIMDFQIFKGSSESTKARGTLRISQDSIRFAEYEIDVDDVKRGNLIVAMAPGQVIKIIDFFAK